MIFIISFISIYLELILGLFLPFLNNNLSLFTTLFSVITVYSIYPLFKDDKMYLIYSFIYGVIYDLFFTNLFLLNGFLFLFVGLISIYIYNNLENSIIKNIIYIIFIISLYYFVFSILIFIFNLVPISFNKYIYIVKSSMISNIIYGTIIYLVINKFMKNNNKLSFKYLK